MARLLLRTGTISNGIAGDIKSTVERVVHDHGFDLYDLDLPTQAGGTLRVFLYRSDEKIDVEDCARVSRALDGKVDFPFSWTLEVSSPGAFRRLRAPLHFALAVGRQARIHLRGRTYEGTIAEAREEDLILQTKRERVNLRYANITKAHLNPSLDFSKEAWNEKERNI